MAIQPIRTIKMFYCYAHEDDALREQLARHLSPLRRLRHVTAWFDRDIQAGTDWEHEIETHLDTAGIILLLVSADFMASDYCYSVEMQQALEKHRAGTAQVIPIILRPVAWEETPIGELSALPTSKKPVTQWVNRDEAWLDVVQGIREVVKTFLPRQILSLQETQILYPELENQQLQHAAVLSSQADSSSAHIAVMNSGNGVKCPKCGFEGGSGSKFCPYDGEPLTLNAIDKITPMSRIPLSGRLPTLSERERSFQSRLVSTSSSPIAPVPPLFEDASEILRRICDDDIPASWWVIYPPQKGLIWRSLGDALDTGGMLGRIVAALGFLFLFLLMLLWSLPMQMGFFVLLSIACGFYLVAGCVLGVFSWKAARTKVLVMTADQLLWGDWQAQLVQETIPFENYTSLDVDEDGKGLQGTKVIPKRGGRTKTKKECISLPRIFGPSEDLVGVIADAHKNYLSFDLDNV